MYFAVIDLTPVTGEFGDVVTAVTTALGVAAGAGLAIAAIKYGGKSAWRFMKSLSN